MGPPPLLRMRSLGGRDELSLSWACCAPGHEELALLQLAPRVRARRLTFRVSRAGRIPPPPAGNLSPQAGLIPPTCSCRKPPPPGSLHSCLRGASWLRAHLRLACLGAP
ncbi:unnamed protein product [Rangifer tarandus platyrhynchus]|uniref:Uncharacterized protein n=1 Tax=Rangifer tarandus platyrhynchus TaxID=3082113 RepID=A0ABN9A2G4_RANTA|nr:unnamed protein product [Rangifer tarandus platyrhynchus]